MISIIQSVDVDKNIKCGYDKYKDANLQRQGIHLGRSTDLTKTVWTIMRFYLVPGWIRTRGGKGLVREYNPSTTEVSTDQHGNVTYYLIMVLYP